jgi:hypothetical protein
MANPHHLKLLVQNVAAWNAWREQHPEITPDLRETCLHGAFHGGLDLHNINLSGADFPRDAQRDAILKRTTGVAPFIALNDVGGCSRDNFRRAVDGGGNPDIPGNAWRHNEW